MVQYLREYVNTCSRVGMRALYTMLPKLSIRSFSHPRFHELLHTTKTHFSGIYDTKCKKNANLSEICIAKETKIV